MDRYQLLLDNPMKLGGVDSLKLCEAGDRSRQRPSKYQMFAKTGGALFLCFQCRLLHILSITRTRFGATMTGRKAPSDDKKSGTYQAISLRLRSSCGHSPVVLATGRN